MGKLWSHLIHPILCFCQIIQGILLPSVNRSAINNGFHREIRTDLCIPSSLLDASTDCTVVVMELLPPGAYIDPFQLQFLQELGGLKFICPTVDIEKPEYTALPINISLFAPKFVKDVDTWKINVTVPVHLRYHYPASQPEQEFSSVIIPNPVILIKCTGDYKGPVIQKTTHPCGSDTSAVCHWEQLHYDSALDALQLLVPVGRKVHTMLVVLGTIGITIVGCLSILYQVYKVSYIKDKVS